MKEIIKIIDKIQRRLCVFSLFYGILKGITVSGIAGCFLNLFSLFFSVLWQKEKLFFVFLFGILGGSIYGIVRFPNRKKAALMGDERLGLEERLVTAYENRGKEDFFSQLQRDDTKKRIGQIDLKGKFRFPFTKKQWVVLSISFAFCCLTFFIPSPVKEQTSQREVIEKEIQKEEKNIEKIQEEPEIKQLLDEIEQSKKELHKAKTREEIEKAKQRLWKKTEKILEKTKNKQLIKATEGLVAGLEEKEKNTLVSNTEVDNRNETNASGEGSNGNETNGTSAGSNGNQSNTSNKGTNGNKTSSSQGNDANQTNSAQGNPGNESNASNQNSSKSNKQNGSGTGSSNQGEGQNSGGSGNGQGSGNGEGSGSGQGSGNGQGWNYGSQVGEEEERSENGSMIWTQKQIGNDKELQGEKQENGTSYQEKVESAGEVSGETVPYEQVIADYKAEAYSQMEQKQYTKNMQDTIKKYFEGLNQ